MNVIFLDFDGVLNTWHDHYSTKQEVNEKYDKRIKILSDICKKYNCKIVIESAYKSLIDEETLETDIEWIKEYFDWFKKYDIECIGRTPLLEDCLNGDLPPIWKEDEIRLYLLAHPEIDHYVVLDDDDLVTIPDRKIGNFSKSDLNAVRNHLVNTLNVLENDILEEGISEKHIDEVGEKLKEENEIKKYAFKIDNKY